MRNSNEYLNAYMKARYKKRREFALAYLGGKCVHCGATEDLEFDHIDRKEKEATIADMMLWAKDRLLKELDKCQLLCKSCHNEKTLKDLNKKNAKNSHGTISSYRYCKCHLCKTAKSEYTKKKKQEKKLYT